MHREDNKSKLNAEISQLTKDVASNEAIEVAA